MNSLAVRPAEPGDLRAIQDLNHLLFLEELVRDPLLDTSWPLSKVGEGYFKSHVLGNRRRCACFVATEGERVIGYVAAALRSNDGTRPVKRAELENMLILPEWRSKGLGKQLVEACVSWAKKRGVERLVVKAYSANASALTFYERHGFQEISKTLEMPLD
jgi:GNAT superfamily N-acetyltransferase